MAPRVSLILCVKNGLPYLTESSDLDLLWPLSSVTQAKSLTSDIAGIARAIRTPAEMASESAGRRDQNYPCGGGVTKQSIVERIEQLNPVRGTFDESLAAMHIPQKCR